MSTTESQLEPRRSSRWFQYSLRTLLVLMVLASIGMSWFAVKLQMARVAERNAADAEKAKAGLLATICAEDSPFIGKPKRSDLERMPITRGDQDPPTEFHWSIFRINVKQKSYEGTVLKPELRTSWTYSGRFTVGENGEWTPGKPEVMEARWGSERMLGE